MLVACLQHELCHIVEGIGAPITTLVQLRALRLSKPLVLAAVGPQCKANVSGSIFARSDAQVVRGSAAVVDAALADGTAAAGDTAIAAPDLVAPAEAPASGSSGSAEPASKANKRMFV